MPGDGDRVGEARDQPRRGEPGHRLDDRRHARGAEDEHAGGGAQHRDAGPRRLELGDARRDRAHDRRPARRAEHAAEAPTVERVEVGGGRGDRQQGHRHQREDRGEPAEDADVDLRGRARGGRPGRPGHRRERGGGRLGGVLDDRDEGGGGFRRGGAVVRRRHGETTSMSVGRRRAGAQSTAAAQTSCTAMYPTATGMSPLMVDSPTGTRPRRSPRAPC